ncbi:hypothetical protein Leryth_000802 [Lithospermum erythrorhizon]|nr:hypothetical protein Leryth_000802 [Lithospermum erythrorhizon]
MVSWNKSFLLIVSIIIISLTTCMNSQDSTIYEVLKDHGLPMGLLPKGVKDFSLDANGNFQVHLDQPCNAKFENEIHYDKNVSGVLSYGQIDGLSGISAQELFLWFPVKEIRVDIPSSGLIYFDVGVVSKQFSLSSFETPRDCIAVQLSDLHLRDGMHILQALAKRHLIKRCDLRELTSRKALQWLLSRSIVECTCPQSSYLASHCALFLSISSITLPS